MTGFAITSLLILTDRKPAISLYRLAAAALITPGRDGAEAFLKVLN